MNNKKREMIHHEIPMEDLLMSDNIDFSREFLDSIEQKVPHLKFTSLGGVVPVQGYGVYHDLPFYFRYRHGRARLTVGGDDVVWNPLYESLVSYGDSFQGSLSEEEFTEVFFTCVKKLERAPFTYEFEGFCIEPNEEKTGFRRSDSKCVYYSRGHSPEEAFKKFTARDSISESLGLTFDTKLEIHQLREINETPLNEDDRIFPKEDPSFIVSP